MTNPGDYPFLVHQESAWDPMPTCSRHPRIRHRAFVGGLFVIERHAVGHLFSHLLDKRGDQLIIALPAILPDYDQTLILIFLMDLVQVRDRDLARATPRGPKFNQVSFIRFERFYLIPLYPLARRQFRSRIAYF